MYRQGEVVLIPVPFSDLTATKKRPVLVISNDSYNSGSQDILVAAITSNLYQDGVRLDTANMAVGVMPKPSMIRCDKLYSLEQAIVVKSVGEVQKEIIASVKEGILALLN